MEPYVSVVLGLALGLATVVVIGLFPGDPFDYEKYNVDARNATKASGGASNSGAQAQTPQLNGDASCLAARTREVEVAASQLKINKLQELLGLEKDELSQMIETAKRDAIDGREAPSPPNYARWLDYAFYVVIFALMIIVLRTEYSLDAAELFAYVFPREFATARRVLAVPRQLLDWTQ